MVTCRSHGSVALLAQATRMGFTEAVTFSAFILGALLAPKVPTNSAPNPIVCDACPACPVDAGLFGIGTLATLLAVNVFAPVAVWTWSCYSTVCGLPGVAAGARTGGLLSHLAVHASDL